MLKGKTAVVTGGAQGIGLAIAHAFVEQGARVVIGDLNENASRRAVEELGGESVTCHTVCDVRDTTLVEQALDTAEEAFGPVDIFVNNAGLTRDATMRKMSEEDFDMVIAVHLKGAWNGTRAAARRMRERESGVIVNISSMSGKVGNIGQTNYSAAKAGIVGLTKAAAKELAFKGVRVNAVQPGFIDTPMTEAMPEHVKQQKLAEIPMGRVGQPAEVASVVVFLASDMSSYMTGAVLEVAGGRYM
ncbi:3-oxoacyl-ACP reductase FabG [Saccharopolyspora phatthalungensis]|uniref:3-oxoacyl-[acyl-carrier protein] reductase n=1 Tax=Saccharopolyspora phatthalungensis TaxID=664693 RepID=A0A840Q4B5_9PSEU|nr:3-oxoacyl-ACP reductase FabG [Saccharopolyspora phatthalungensis]MBB5157332.1 3-oxoacyl-[acyl-carrier protein] reductase [Saccharopolyspora phatthalungensis]